MSKEIQILSKKYVDDNKNQIEKYTSSMNETNYEGISINFTDDIIMHIKAKTQEKLNSLLHTKLNINLNSESRITDKMHIINKIDDFRIYDIKYEFDKNIQKRSGENMIHIKQEMYGDILKRVMNIGEKEVDKKIQKITNTNTTTANYLELQEIMIKKINFIYNNVNNLFDLYNDCDIKIIDRFNCNELDVNISTESQIIHEKILDEYPDNFSNLKKIMKQIKMINDLFHLNNDLLKISQQYINSPKSVDRVNVIDLFKKYEYVQFLDSDLNSNYCQLFDKRLKFEHLKKKTEEIFSKQKKMDIKEIFNNTDPIEIYLKIHFREKNSKNKYSSHKKQSRKFKLACLSEIKHQKYYDNCFLNFIINKHAKDLINNPKSFKQHKFLKANDSENEMSDDDSEDSSSDKSFISKSNNLKRKRNRKKLNSGESNDGESSGCESNDDNFNDDSEPLFENTIVNVNNTSKESNKVPRKK
jgi:hypothetical protein